MLGNSGSGIYNLSAGTGTFNGGLTLGFAAGSLGVVNQTGGTAMIGGGSLNLAHAFVAVGTPSGSIYNLLGGTLQVGAAQMESSGLALWLWAGVRCKFTARP